MTNEKIVFKVDKERFFKEKNILINKCNKLKEQFAAFKIGIVSGVKLSKKDLKVKRPSSFDSIKRTFQRFIIKTRYY